jgi:hypothetical protein
VAMSVLVLSIVGVSYFRLLSPPSITSSTVSMSFLVLSTLFLYNGYDFVVKMAENGSDVSRPLYASIGLTAILYVAVKRQWIPRLPLWALFGLAFNTAYLSLLSTVSFLESYGFQGCLPMVWLGAWLLSMTNHEAGMTALAGICCLALMGLLTTASLRSSSKRLVSE